MERLSYLFETIAIAHEYPLDMEERLENIAMAMNGYISLKQMCFNVKHAVDAV